MATGTEWTTDALLASIRRRASFPTGDEAWSDDDILALATEAMRDYILPTIREVHEEFLVQSHDISVVAGTTEYRLPKRFAAESMRLVLMSDGTGGYVPMTRVEPESARKLQIGFYLEDDKLVTAWTPTQATTIRVKYYWRPSKLVVITRGLTISSIDGPRLTILAVESTAGIVGDSSLTDFTGASPGNRIRDFDVEVSTASPPTYNMTSAVDASVSVGDYMTLAGESIVPQIPAELHPLLAQRVAVKLGEGQGGSAGYDAALAELGAMEKRARSLFAERTEGNPRFVHNFYAPGWGRSTIRRQTGGL